MKIAILEDDKSVIDKIQQKIENIFELSFYQDVYEFIRVCQNFDLVLIDKKFINKELIDQISRYKLEIGVLNNKGNVEFDDEHIAIVLDKDDLNQIEEKLKYFETKIRINRLLETEEETLGKMQKITMKSEFLRNKQKETEEILRKIVKSTYYFEEIENIGILEIRDVLRQIDKDEIFEALKNVNYNVAVYFSFNHVVSKHLGDLANLWKDVKKLNGNIVYWNKQNNTKVICILKLCKLDNILSIVDSFEDVKLKLKEIKNANV
jgi:DNA repair exonuclease SbcCD ATPase subunit